MQRTDSNHSQSGLALVELALLIPVFIITLYGIIDVADFLNEHYKISLIAYEGTRFASHAEKLEAGTCVKNGAEAISCEKITCSTDTINATTTCTPCTSERCKATLPVHKTIFDRIDSLLTAQYGGIPAPIEDIPTRRTVTFQQSKAGIPMVSITISVPHKSFFGKFFTKDGSVVASETTAYLVNTQEFNKQG